MGEVCRVLCSGVTVVVIWGGGVRGCAELRK